MALFTSSQDHVHCCPTHLYPERSQGVMEADHLVRCNSEMATYILDPHTFRHSVVVPYKSSSGRIEFDLDVDKCDSLPVQKKNSENCFTLKYSNAKNKLYVKQGERCPISFSSTLKEYSDVYIRTVALFKISSDVVHCCLQHSFSEHVSGVPEAGHFVRCESETAVYLCDPETNRHSVVVPLECPPAGQNATTYLYKFACLGSCVGGPNRRPLMLVFTLERRNKVLGRQVVDLKVCACPERDRKKEEQQQHSPNQKASSKRKFSQLTAEELAGFQVDSFANVPTDNFYTLEYHK
ncbi:cellular tumor antigen p53-like [Uloborus diversus]|uniref:cellular tumor antigen p53-like n=1 Tax=Uloborus diversus TaxID=327109 RepID=UPI0024097B15|nr:cellular tumor antigen p53-like [Uloborus diversus]